MRILSVRLAKIRSAFQQNGFKNALSKIVQDGLLFLKGILAYEKPGRVLLISGGVGDSARYRTFNVAEDLRLRKITALAVNQSNFWLEFLIKNFSIIVFHHRVIRDKKLNKVLGIAQKLNKKIVFDTDDLVLSKEQWKKTEYYQQAGQEERKQYQQSIGEYFLKQPSLSAATASTCYLAQKLKAFSVVPTYVVPNKISQKEVRWSETILASRNKSQKSSEEIRLGYFSGTLSHNRDFATITDVLERLLKKYSQLKLVLVGPLDIGNDFIGKFYSQIERFPFVPRRQHYKNLSQVDINLIPLEIDNEFCQAKSAIKFMEAGLVKVPSVATATVAFQAAIEDGKSGFLAFNQQDWEEKLTDLIENKSKRKEMGQQARQTVLENYITGKGKNIDWIYKKL